MKSSRVFALAILARRSWWTVRLSRQIQSDIHECINDVIVDLEVYKKITFGVEHRKMTRSNDLWINVPALYQLSNLSPVLAVPLFCQ